MKTKITILFILIFAIVSIVIASDKKQNSQLLKPTTLGLVERMNINNIDLPIKNDGSMGEDAQAYYPNGQTNNSFLFQGGFATSGYVTEDSVRELRASWMAAASLIEEWQPGTWGMDPLDGRARFYVVEASDGFGSENYEDWSRAVALGADFQDLNNDGVYDPEVDKPDMLGDKTIWFPINDSTSVAQRTPRLNTSPLGLEIFATVFAFARTDALGDVIFIRYRFHNPTQNDIEDLIFSIWEDPDIGDADDDLIGCDTTLSLGYVYNDADDITGYGNTPPAHGVDFFQGPIVDSPGDTAFMYRGPFFGVDTLYDKRNLPMTSFMFYINADPDIPDPDIVDIARNYQLGGLDAEGAPLVPTDWGTGANANTDPRYVFSGDPVSGDGWIDTTPDDKRFLVNCGPFQLPSDETQDIVVAYVVAQGSDAIDAVRVLKSTDDFAQKVYDANFVVAGPPPPPKVDARIYDNKIELFIDLEANGTLAHNATDLLNTRQIFEGIKVYQYHADNIGDLIGGVENAKTIKYYDLDNQYDAIFAKSRDGAEVTKIWDGYNNLDTSVTPIIKLDIETDAFNNDDNLINNTEYYFAVTVLSINVNSAQPYFPDTSFARSVGWIVGGESDMLESSPTTTFMRLTPGSNEFKKFETKLSEYSGSRPFYDGEVFFEPVAEQDITGNEYEVTFFDNGTRWKLKDVTLDSTLFDSMTVQLDSIDNWDTPFVVDGFSVKILNVPDEPDTAFITADDTSNIWLNGNSESAFKTSSVLNDGVNLVVNERSTITYNKREKYIPIRIDFDTTNIAKGYAFFGKPFSIYRGVHDIFAKAYDISDPANERQLNIAYRIPSFTSTDLTFQNGNEIIVMNSDYNDVDAYTSAPDSNFKADALVILNLKTVTDSLITPDKMSITVIPKYPNSDDDAFRFSTQGLVARLTNAERKAALNKVRVVPNPYFAYSRYETSYDSPQLKFTHLDNLATIRIFSLAGQQIRVLEKNDETTNELYWDLRNEAGLKVASGMYIAHVEVPGIGSKIVKFAILQREERIDRY